MLQLISKIRFVSKLAGRSGWEFGVLMPQVKVDIRVESTWGFFHFETVSESKLAAW